MLAQTASIRLAVVSRDGYAEQTRVFILKNQCLPKTKNDSHTDMLVGTGKKTRMVPAVVTSRVHCATGKNLVSHPGYMSIYMIYDEANTSRGGGGGRRHGRRITQTKASA